MRAGAFVHHSNREQDGETRPAGSEVGDTAGLWRIATACAALRQRGGARTLLDRRNDYGGRSAARRIGESYLRTGGADSRGGSDGEKNHRQRAAGREVHDGSDRARRRDAPGRRALPGSDAFWVGLRDGRYARRNESVFGEKAAAVQGKVEEVQEVDEEKDRKRSGAQQR